MVRFLVPAALAIALSACQPGTAPTPGASGSPSTGTPAPGASGSPAASATAAPAATPAATPAASATPAAAPSAPASIAPGVTTYFDGVAHYDGNTVAKYQGDGLMIHGKTDSGRYPESTLTLYGVGGKRLLAGFTAADVERIGIFVNGTQLRPSFGGGPEALNLVSTTGRLVGVAEGQTRGQNAAGMVDGPMVRMEFDLALPLAPAE